MDIVTKREEVREFFKKVVKENGLDGILLSDMEGLGLVSYLDESMDEETISASAAAIMSAGFITTSDTGKSGLNQIVLDTDDGYIVFIPIKDEYILAVMAPKDTKLGILRIIAKNVEEFLEKI
ncbi:MAG: dynein regulation protein LC7 [Aquificae bacterium]|nr:dynein regulation protein LC7 [Aquificota bacterium]